MASGDPVYNRTDPDKPWVIGGSEDVLLGPGRITPGRVPELGVEVLFVIENARVRIEDHLQGEELALPAWIVMCDDAQLSVNNATLRFEQPWQFAYGFITYDQSSLRFSQALLHGTPAGQNGGYKLPGFFCGSSTVQVEPAPDYGLAMLSGDMLEWVFSETTTADIAAMGVVGELYAEDRASFNIVNSGMFAMWLNPLPSSESVIIAGLPPVCDIVGAQDPATNDPSDDCSWDSATAPITNYVTPPGTTPFHVNIQDSWVFSWAVTTWPGSNVHFDVGPEAFLGIGVNLDVAHSPYDLLLQTGKQTSSPLGLDDRQLTFSETSSVFAWHAWGAEDVDIAIREGSQVGDFSVLGSSHSTAVGSHFEFGDVTIEPEAHAAIVDSAVSENSYVRGVLRLKRTVVLEPMIVNSGALLILEDSSEPTSLLLEQGSPDAELLRVAVTSPDEDATVTAPVSIRGSVVRRNVVSDLPLSAELEVRPAGGEWSAIGEKLTESVREGELGSFTPEPGRCGEFELRVRLAAPAKAEGDVMVSRRLTIDCATGSGGAAGAGGTAGDEPAKAESDGCGCGFTRRPVSWPLGISAIGALCLLRRRRSRSR